MYKINYKILDKQVYEKKGGTYYCFLLSFPIKNPYELSFGTVESFDTIYVIKITENGIGAGEVTALPGYSDETIGDLWFIQNEIAKDICNLDNYGNGFKTVAFKTCLESYNSRWLIEDKQLHSNYAKICNKKYDLDAPVVKIKIGKSVDEDIKKVRNAQEHSYKIRVDANQGYSLEEALYFLDNISSNNIEYVEQLLKKDAWAEMRELRLRHREFSFLLDESIFIKQDINRAKQHEACDAIKLKLFKHGSVADTLDIAQHALKNQFQVVLGNGVQTVIGAFYEMYCYDLLKKNIMFNNYSEINGPLKIDGFEKNRESSSIRIASCDIMSLIKEMIER